MNLTLTRTYGETETISNLLIDGEYFCKALELPWKDNEHNVSCIPEGVYSCQIRPSSDYGHVIELKDVPARSAILIHPGNVVTETQGCILPGFRLGWLNGHRAVLSSRKAFAALLQMTRLADNFDISIQEAS